MRQYTLLLIVVMLTPFIITACGESSGGDGENPYGHYEDDQMIGTVKKVLENENRLIVDISEWEKRDVKGQNTEDIGYSYNAKLSEETIIQHENGEETSIDHIKLGQKVLVNPPRSNNFEGQPDEIILLEMSYEDKYSRLLSHIDGFNIVVMNNDDQKLPDEMQETLYKNVLNILDGTEHDAVAAWHHYNEDYIVDYQAEFEIEQFPVILVFDQEELLFKTNKADELYNYFKNLSE